MADHLKIQIFIIRPLVIKISFWCGVTCPSMLASFVYRVVIIYIDNLLNNIQSIEKLISVFFLIVVYLQHNNKLIQQSRMDCNQKPTKTPRKRQRKKALVACQFESNGNLQSEISSINQHSQQQQQLQQHPSQQTGYYDVNNKWNSTSLKIQSNGRSTGHMSPINIPNYVDHNATAIQQQQSQRQQSQAQPQQQGVIQQHQGPQPAHMQSSQAQSHPPNLSYYQNFSQQVASHYSASVQQGVPVAGAIQHTLDNVNQQQQNEHEHPKQNVRQLPHHQPQRPQPQELPETQIPKQQISQSDNHHPLQLANLYRTPQQNRHDKQQHQQEQQQNVPVVQQPRPLTDNSNVCSKVIVPNIEEELEFLLETVPKEDYVLTTNNSNKKRNNCNLQIPSDNNSSINRGMRSYNNYSSIQNIDEIRTTGKGRNSIYLLPNNRKPLFGTSIGKKKTQFIQSYLKFLQGEREESFCITKPKVNRRTITQNLFVNSVKRIKIDKEANITNNNNNTNNNNVTNTSNNNNSTNNNNYFGNKNINYKDNINNNNNINDKMVS